MRVYALEFAWHFSTNDSFNILNDPWNAVNLFQSDAFISSLNSNNFEVIDQIDQTIIT